MTGPERETLVALLRSVETFRTEVREDFAGVRASIFSLDGRVQGMERADARAAGIATGRADVAEQSSERAAARSLSVRGWIAVGVAAGTGLASLLLKIMDALNAPH